MLTPVLFSIYAEMMKKAVEDLEGAKVAGEWLKDVRFANGHSNRFRGWITMDK